MPDGIEDSASQDAGEADPLSYPPVLVFYLFVSPYVYISAKSEAPPILRLRKLIKEVYHNVVYQPVIYPLQIEEDVIQRLRTIEESVALGTKPSLGVICTEERQAGLHCTEMPK